MSDEGGLVRFENEEQADWAQLTPVQRYMESVSYGPLIWPWEAVLIQSPIHKALLTFRNCNVRFLLMGGQAYFLYGDGD